MKKKWEYYEEDNKKEKHISDKFKISELLAKLLINRGITEDDEIETFLNPKRNDFYDPFLILDMEKAVSRILKAIKSKEKVIIYGDYDVDGITSTAVLKKFLAERGLDADYYIPNRLEEGYGLNKEAISDIVGQGYTLVITVDCGISAASEVDTANKLGLEIIITDHHKPPEKLPKALAVIDLKRKDNTAYPFKELAGVGVVFKLIQAISIKLGLDEKEYLKYLDLVCMGTISDIVPLINENRVIAKFGLKLMKVTRNIGLRELIKLAGYKEINAAAVSFGIAPRINACGRMGHQDEAIRLLLTEDTLEAKEIADRLNLYNMSRQSKEKEIFDHAIEKIEEENIEQLNSIVLFGDNWHHGVVRNSCIKTCG
ncbi:MAG: DHH family phosphoesterase [Firmicutes bacterium]|nr:DHH family phosphoesterase [Bacillota bacterium]